MNFFRLRITNTLLVLLIGLILGYLIKDRLGTKEADRYIPIYPRGHIAAKPAPDDSFETLAAKDPAAGDRWMSASTGSRAVSPRAKTRETAEDFVLPVKPGPEADYDITYSRSDFQTSAGFTGPSQAYGGAVSGPMAFGRPKTSGLQPSTGAAPQTPGAADGPPARAADAENKDDVVKNAEEGFFKNPERYAAQDLELELQMILARKTQNGWLLNFVHARGGKNVDYVYMEDDFLLGEKPELKIGYFYNVTFKCAKGDLSAGNKLLGINPSGKKAAWATGVSAIE
ncbi:MAG: hypothetical protein HY796_01465 [Elusimicrobia bacterium]|nr:hypothetical protein [Elusimicrobiota bacterium]